MKFILALSALVAFTYAAAAPAEEETSQGHEGVQERDIFGSWIGNGIRKSQDGTIARLVNMGIQAGKGHKRSLEEDAKDADVEKRDIFGSWIGNGIRRSQAGTTARLVNMGIKAGHKRDIEEEDGSDYHDEEYEEKTGEVVGDPQA
jgi:hypothetical protein